MLTGFLICGHLWDHHPGGWDTPWQQWNRRAQTLIPPGLEATRFSASRIFAAAYPEAISLACLIASPRWRSLAAGDAGQRQQVIAEIGRRLGRRGYQPPENGDAIVHWIEYDSWQPPSQPSTTYPQTRDHGAPRPAAASQQSLQRQERSTAFFALNRRGGNVILHHRHIRPVLIRDWSPPWTASPPPSGPARQPAILRAGRQHGRPGHRQAAHPTTTPRKPGGVRTDKDGSTAATAQIIRSWRVTSTSQQT